MRNSISPRKELIDKRKFYSNATSEIIFLGALNMKYTLRDSENPDCDLESVKIKFKRDTQRDIVLNFAGRTIISDKVAPEVHRQLRKCEESHVRRSSGSCKNSHGNGSVGNGKLRTAFKRAVAPFALGPTGSKGRKNYFYFNHASVCFVARGRRHVVPTVHRRELLGNCVLQCFSATRSCSVLLSVLSISGYSGTQIL